VGTYPEVVGDYIIILDQDEWFMITYCPKCGKECRIRFNGASPEDLNEILSAIPKCTVCQEKHGDD